MFEREYYIRISDDRQDVLRQVEGLKKHAATVGDEIPEDSWKLVAQKSCATSPVKWDYGSRDMAEQRPNFQTILKRVEKQNPRDPKRLKELVVYDFDRFGTADLTEWFARQYAFRKSGCKITEASTGRELTSMEDANLMERFMQGWKSTREQKDTAKRVAEQTAHKAKQGVALGGVANWGYDWGCFDSDEVLLWRVHYLSWSDKIQVLYDPHGNEIQRIPFGEKDSPKKSNSQRLALIPSLALERIQCVRDLFAIVVKQVPAIGWLGITKQLSTLGHRSYEGKVFDRESLRRMVTNPVYMGFKTQNKFTRARHKRYSTNGIEDVLDHEKNRQISRPKDQWIIPTNATNLALIDEPTFLKAQELITKIPKREYYAPRSENFYLKPILYCGQCGRHMVGKTTRGKTSYHCLTSVYRSSRPGDARFQTECGFNSVAHDEVEALIMGKLEGLQVELESALEDGALKRIEQQIINNEEEFYRECGNGYKTHLRRVWSVFELDTNPTCQLAKIIEELLETEFDEDNLETLQTGLTEIEKLKVNMARQQIDQLTEEHRHLTLAQARANVSPRQMQVLESECHRLDNRMSELERELSPLRDQLEKLQNEYRDLIDEREEVIKTMQKADSRAKGAALTRIFSKVLCFFRKENEGWKGRGRRGRMISVFEPEKTVFVLNGDVGCELSNCADTARR